MRRYQWPIGAILCAAGRAFSASVCSRRGQPARRPLTCAARRTKPASGPITTSGKATGAHVALAAPARPNVVLYDQYNNPGTNAIVSQPIRGGTRGLQ